MAVRVVCDEHGDLLLRVGGEEGAEFLVSSSAVRRASLVWDKMLFGPYYESKPAEGPWVVTLPEDNPDAMEIFFNIMHSNFERVPESPETRDIYEVTILTDKYDMLHLIRPWAQRWMDIVKSYRPFVGEERVMAMYIALELGAKTEFYDIATKVALCARVDTQERLVE